MKPQATCDICTREIEEGRHLCALHLEQKLAIEGAIARARDAGRDPAPGDLKALAAFHARRFETCGGRLKQAAANHDASNAAVHQVREAIRAEEAEAHRWNRGRADQLHLGLLRAVLFVRLQELEPVIQVYARTYRWWHATRRAAEDARRAAMTPEERCEAERAAHGYGGQPGQRTGD